MGKPTGFIETARKVGGYRPVQERICDFGEVEQKLNDEDRKAQASRCMDCGVPFCHWACVLNNRNPEWQDALYRGDYKEAYDILSSTNIFPEFTGRVCPALCEKSCVLNIHNEAVTIRENECAVIEKAFESGLVMPHIPLTRSGKKVAVIGSGPSGLSVAGRLNQMGHSVTVFEAEDAIGGLLRYGIPDFKLQKSIIDRRQKLMEAEGIKFIVNTKVGTDISHEEVKQNFDAVCISIGSMVPRDLPVQGRDLKGVNFALDFLKQQNRVIRGIRIADETLLKAEGKHVLIIGGGDTGSDCVGTSIRQKALSVTQIEIMPKPPVERKEDNPWPYWPNILRTSSSHKEGCERRWCLATKRFIGDNGKVTGVEVIEVEWGIDENGRMQMHEIPGTSEIIKAELVLLSMGFLHPEHEGLIESMNIELDSHGNIKTGNCFSTQTSSPGVFVCGDALSGASLVVRAISSGINTAGQINLFLKME